MGDPACWLHATCTSCGRLLEPAERELERCPRCGADIPEEASGP